MEPDDVKVGSVTSSSFRDAGHRGAATDDADDTDSLVYTTQEHYTNRGIRKSVAVFIVFCAIGLLLLFASRATTSSDVGRRLRVPVNRQMVDRNKHYKFNDGTITFYNGDAARSKLLFPIAALDGNSSDVNNTAVPTAAPTPSPSPFSSADGDVDIPVVNYNNIMYTGMVSVGTPPQNLSMIFDTGSVDMWVLTANTDMHGESCHRGDGGPACTVYVSNLSTTFDNSHQENGVIRYGKGNVTGPFVQDSAGLGRLTAEGQFFIATDSVFNISNVEGLVGFAPSESATKPSLVKNLHIQGQLSELKFSFHLSDDENEGGSMLILGEPDMRFAPKGISYFDAHPYRQDQSGHVVKEWFLDLTGFSVGSSSMDTSFCSPETPCPVLMDTGTSLLQMPHEIALKVLPAIVKDRRDCTYGVGPDHAPYAGCQLGADVPGLPVVTFRLHDVEFSLTPEDYLDGHTIAMSSSFANFWIFGDTFLKEHYTVFDMENYKIGIANPRHLPRVTVAVAFAALAIMGGLLAGALGYVRIKQLREDRIALQRGHRLENQDMEMAGMVPGPDDP